MLTRIVKSKTALPARNLLFWAGAAAALMAAVIFRRNLDAEYFLLRLLGIIASGPAGAPATAADWFALLRENRFLGLVLLHFFDIFNFLLFGLMLIALFAALRRHGEALMFVALGLGFIGIAVFVSGNQALTLVSMSDQYLFAPTEAQRQLILGGAQGVLAVNFRESYSGGLYPSFFCVTVSGLLIAVVMLRSKLFGRAAAIMGILANGFGLGYYLLLLLAPGLVPLVISASSLFLLVWYVLIAVRFLRYGHKPAGDRRRR
jgi:hypothetical protein